MKTVKLGCKILLSCATIAVSQAKANLYIGLGTSISNDSYSANSEDLGQAKNLQNFSSFVTQNTIYYDGTFTQMLLNIQGNVPDANGFDAFLFAKYTAGSNLAVPGAQDEIKANTFYGCTNGGYLSSNYVSSDTNPCPQGGKVKELTLPQFYEDIGSAFLYHIKQTDSLYKENFPNNGFKEKLSEDMGREIIKSIINSAKPDIDTTTITIDDINQWFAGGGKLQDIPTSLITLDGSGETLTLSKPNTVVDILGIYEAQWLQIAQGIQNAFIKNQDLINTNAIIKSKASNDNYGLLASLGYLDNNDKLFYGGELLLDIGKYTIGKNQDMELEVSRNLSLGVVGRVGYSFFNKTLNYLSMGLLFAKYKAKGFGINATSTIPSYVIGVGMEFALYKHLNMFLEYQYQIGLSQLDTEVAGAKKLNLKSQKFNVGFRYYLTNNVLMAKKPHNPAPSAKQSINLIQGR